jgi:KDO2-lipid IV(A) lauroyltransferase
MDSSRNSRLASPKLRAFRGRILGGILRFVAAVMRRVPLQAGRAFGRALGAVAFQVLRKERARALRNLAVAFPDWSNAQRLDTIRAMFRHLGMSTIEVLWLPNLDVPTRDRMNVAEGVEPVLALMDSGRGVITFTAHCGNWEWLCSSVGLYGRPVSVLQRERNEAEMNQLITEIRAASGVRTIDRGSLSSAREMMNAIRRGGMLAFVLDQNIRTESVKVPFFGAPALTPIGPAKLAIRMEAMVVVAVTERLEDGRHRIHFDEPWQVKRGDNPVELTRRITAAIEAQIRRRPEQWVWFHDRWRERPEWEVPANMNAG